MNSSINIKNLLLLLIFSVAIILNSGCSRRLVSFEKRKYTKGYHVDLAQKGIRKDKSVYTVTARVIPQQGLKKNVSETPCNSFSEMDQLQHKDEVSAKALPPQVTLIDKKKKTQNIIFNDHGKRHIDKAVSKSFIKMMPKKNTAQIDNQTWIGFITIAGILVAAIGLFLFVVCLLVGAPTFMLLFGGFFLVCGALLIVLGLIFDY